MVLPSRSMTLTVNRWVYLLLFHTATGQQLNPKWRGNSHDPQYAGRHAHMMMIERMVAGPRILSVIFLKGFISGSQTDARQHKAPMSPSTLTTICEFLQLWLATRSPWPA